MSEVLNSDVTKSPLSGASLVLRLTEVRGFRPTAAVIKNERKRRTLVRRFLTGERQ